jgi:DNA polymerase-3 subunit gamma/tau
MSYQVLARKWRPKSFDTLVGQEHVVRALSNALDNQRLHHAYLFTGTRGVGKTIARILAKSLNCQAGISAHPCGVCAACVEIDKGRFIDIIEVDAASNTQIDNMRELLDNAQYAPTAGRFKIYIIDEVHMLTRNSFNAMLKTLEEPPEHMKFILATTDPQKIPVTVLSRCLQFNLRQMSVASIVTHLQSILQQESIPAEAPALHLIAKAAAGSMRDALSLLDQAIAYGEQKVQEKEVRAMLGVVDRHYLFDLMDAVCQQDGQALFEQVNLMNQRSISFDGALADLASLLQRIAVIKSVPSQLAADDPDHERLSRLLSALSDEQIQLFYQICILGRRDLVLAPDELAGFNMTMLRMLAFQPIEDSQATLATPSPSATRPAAPSASPVSASATSAAPSAPAAASPPTSKPAIPESVRLATMAKPSAVVEPALSATAKTVPLSNSPVSTLIEPASASVTPTPEAPHTPDTPIEENPTRSALDFDGNWRGLVDQLKLGLARTLAQHSELVAYQQDYFELKLSEEFKPLLELNNQSKLEQALNEHFGKKIRLTIHLGGVSNTPAQQVSEEREAVQAKAESAIREDSFVQALVNEFDAQVIPSSIKPIQ